VARDERIGGATTAEAPGAGGPEADAATAREHGLTDEEFERLTGLLGRVPT
jgi:hypothetical protein